MGSIGALSSSWVTWKMCSSILRSSILTLSSLGFALTMLQFQELLFRHSESIYSTKLLLSSHDCFRYSLISYFSLPWQNFHHIFPQWHLTQWQSPFLPVARVRSPQHPILHICREPWSQLGASAEHSMAQKKESQWCPPITPFLSPSQLYQLPSYALSISSTANLLVIGTPP
jgi:hypothetical protein